MSVITACLSVSYYFIVYIPKDKEHREDNIKEYLKCIEKDADSLKKEVIQYKTQACKKNYDAKKIEFDTCISEARIFWKDNDKAYLLCKKRFGVPIYDPECNDISNETVQKLFENTLTDSTCFDLYPKGYEEFVKKTVATDRK